MKKSVDRATLDFGDSLSYSRRNRKLPNYDDTEVDDLDEGTMASLEKYRPRSAVCLHF